MRPYIAVLKDSFREAMASRVLWIALIGIAVILLLLAPFGLKIEKATQLRRSEIANFEKLLQAIADGQNEMQTPAAQIWNQLTDEQKKQLKRLQEPEQQAETGRDRRAGSSRQREVVTAMNKLLDNPDLFDKTSWADVKLPQEATDLIAQGNLGAESSKRLNLLALSAAFPKWIVVTESNAISLVYATATLVDSIPLTPSQFELVFETAVVAVLSVFLGFIGIFASLLVTAPLIPRTFEPGEIALLLSKPVNRGLLYITKFLGGCTFTLMYSTVLVTGVWFLLGTRMLFWRTELFWCIPIYVFLFMIYFSVSALAGAIWRNSTVALRVVLWFWLGIKVVEVAKVQLEDNLVRSKGIKEITVAGDSLLVIDGRLNTRLWNPKTSEWDEVFRVQSPGGPDFSSRIWGANSRLTHTFDSATQQIFSLQTTPGRFGAMGVPELVAGSADEDWERIPLGRTPDVVETVLIDRSGRVLLPGKDAIYEYVGQTENQQKQAKFLGAFTGGLLGGGKAFRSVKVDKYPDVKKSISSALNSTSDQILIYSEGDLHLLNPAEDGGYTLQTSVNLDTSKQAVIAASGKYCIVGLGDGRVIVVDCNTLNIVTELPAEPTAIPRVCVAATDGSWLAVLRHDESVTLFSGDSGQRMSWSPPESGVCTAVASSPDGKLLVSDGRLAVRQYDIGSAQQTAEWSQPTSWVYDFYDLAIYPIWSALPKPSQLDRFVPFVMSGEDSVLVNETRGPPGSVDRESLQQERETFNYNKVFRDNAIFVLIMLGLGCLYVSRSDF